MAYALTITPVEMEARARQPAALLHAPLSSEYLSRLSGDEVCDFFRVLEEALQVRTHRDLLHWLQGELQAFLPHCILLAAWGDFALGLVYYDVISPLPGIRTDLLDEQRITPLLQCYFQRWQGCDGVPCAMPAAEDLRWLVGADTPGQGCETATELTVLVHGIKDQRGRHDCLYVLFGGAALGTRDSGEALASLLPYLDTALRQVSHLPEQYPSLASTAETGAEAGSEKGTSELSAREIEVLRWVGKGKTNSEIGAILGISAFTVKNHLRRIFRKLDVLNRAQAMARLQAGNFPRRVAEASL